MTFSFGECLILKFYIFLEIVVLFLETIGFGLKLADVIDLLRFVNQFLHFAAILSVLAFGLTDYAIVVV
jgi:hypothetical protein